MIDDDELEEQAKEQRKKKRLRADLAGGLFSILALAGIFFPGVRALLIIGAVGGFFSGLGFSLSAEVSVFNKTPKKEGDKPTRHLGDTSSNLLYAAGLTSTLGFIITAIGFGLAASTLGPGIIIAAPAIFAVSAICWGVSAALDFFKKPTLASGVGLTAASTNMIAAGIAVGLVLGATGPALPFVLGAAAVVSAVTWVASAFMNYRANKKKHALKQEAIELEETERLADDGEELEFSPGLQRRLEDTQQSYQTPISHQEEEETRPLLSSYRNSQTSSRRQLQGRMGQEVPTLDMVKSKIKDAVASSQRFNQHHIKTKTHDGGRSIQILDSNQSTALEVKKDETYFDFTTSQRWVPPETISIMAISLLEVGQAPEIYGGSCNEVIHLLNEMDRHRKPGSTIEPSLPDYFTAAEIERCQPYLDKLKIPKEPDSPNASVEHRLQ